jgi:site-specific DNA recombinase
LNEGAEPDQKLLPSVVRAQAWLVQLHNGNHVSIESLAATVQLHPKVIRQCLRLALLSPGITSAIIEGKQPASLSLSAIPKTLGLSWASHHLA